MNDGPLCKCSAKARRTGIRHSIYPGEEVRNKSHGLNLARGWGGGKDVVLLCLNVFTPCWTVGALQSGQLTPRLAPLPRAGVLTVHAGEPDQ